MNKKIFLSLIVYSSINAEMTQPTLCLILKQKVESNIPGLVSSLLIPESIEKSMPVPDLSDLANDVQSKAECDGSVEVVKEEFLRVVKEYCQRNKLEFETEALVIKDGFAVLQKKGLPQAIVIIENIEEEDIFVLSDQEKQEIKESYPLFFVQTHGKYKFIHFFCEEDMLLPENKKQAAFLLYSPYITSKLGALPAQSPLNEIQKKYIYFQMNQNDEAEKEASAYFDPEEYCLSSYKIKTDIGYRRIKDLKVADIVVCYDIKSNKEELKKITQIENINLPWHMEIELGEKKLFVAPGHRFHVLSTNALITVEDLMADMSLSKLIDSRIKSVQEVERNFALIKICTEGSHEFCIPDQDVVKIL